MLTADASKDLSVIENKTMKLDNVTKQTDFLNRKTQHTVQHRISGYFFKFTPNG